MIHTRLDEIQSTDADREGVADRLALSLSNAELVELMLIPLLADEAHGLTLVNCREEEAELLVGRIGHKVRARLGRPGKDALVVLRDRDVALVSDDRLLHGLWGTAMTFSTPALLRALQFARDDADDILYRPPADRIGTFTQRASEWGISAALLKTLSANRYGLHCRARPLEA